MHSLARLSLLLVYQYILTKEGRKKTHANAEVIKPDARTAGELSHRASIRLRTRARSNAAAVVAHAGIISTGRTGAVEHAQVGGRQVAVAEVLVGLLDLLGGGVGILADEAAREVAGDGGGGEGGEEESELHGC